MTLRRGRRLAIDVGDARIGVASCDPDGILATPVETVPGRDIPAAHRRLRQLFDGTVRELLALGDAELTLSSDRGPRRRRSR